MRGGVAKWEGMALQKPDELAATTRAPLGTIPILASKPPV